MNKIKIFLSIVFIIIALFLCINEAQGIDNFSNADILKTRITEPTIPIDPKGIQGYQIDNMVD
jgi:preprotein translocase subunit SecG